MQRERRLGELLIAAGLIDERQLAVALRRQGSTGARLGETLLLAGFVDEFGLSSALARQLGLPFVLLDGLEISVAMRAVLPDALCMEFMALPVARSDGLLTVATSEPHHPALVDRLSAVTGLDIRVVVATPSHIRNALIPREAQSAS